MTKKLNSMKAQVTTINQRVHYIMNELEMSETQFARKVGVSKGAVVNVIKNNEDPSYALLRNIVTVFPVSQKWIYLGEGHPWTAADISKWKHGGEDEGYRPADLDMNNRVKQIRIENNLSQTLFAAELEVTRDIICNMETNRTIPTVPMVKHLHKKLGVNPMWIMYGDKPQYLSSPPSPKKKGA
jgi:DNA-binding XRE family transcriptional regulator